MGMTNSFQPVKICICIATCRRVPYLKILLSKIIENKIPDYIDLKVVVVDNDPEKGAEQFVKDVATTYKVPLIYGSESQRGIPFTRNKAVSLADKDVDFIVFIDDDEYPDVNWIAKLYEAQQQTGADLVQGPAYPEFLETPPTWIVKGGFFVAPFFNQKTGTKLSHYGVATNNLLVKYSLLMKLNGPFDETMGLIGCDDNALGINLHKLGCNMVYSKDAIVYEFIPKSRTTIKWLLQRAYRTANTHWLLTQDKNIFKLIKLFIGALARIVIFPLFLLPALIIAPIFGFQYVIKLLRLIVRGVAIIAGIFGKNYEEYRHAYTIPAAN